MHLHCASPFVLNEARFGADHNKTDVKEAAPPHKSDGAVFLRRKSDISKRPALGPDALAVDPATLLRS